MLTNEEIKLTFINTPLEENYNFLESDLVKLAQAFIVAAEKKARASEREKCVRIVRSLNKEVARALEESCVSS